MVYLYQDWNSCGPDTSAESWCGWTDVEPPAGGDGIACSADVNSDSVVDVTDLLAVMSSWYDDVVCEPTYECLDLNNLPSGMGG